MWGWLWLEKVERADQRQGEGMARWLLVRMGEAGVCVKEDLLGWGLSEVWGVYLMLTSP